MLKSKIWAIVIVLIVFSGISSVYSQNDDVKKPKKTPEERAKMMTDRMNEKLQLSTDQYNTIYDLFLGNIQQNRADRQTYSGSKDELKKMIKERNKATRQKVKGLLTDEQKTKIKEMRKQRKMEKGKNKEGKKHKNKQNMKQYK